MKIKIINGPNLNMLGKRPKEHYGTKTLDEINEMIKKEAEGCEVSFFQSNHEGDIIDEIQASIGVWDAIVINPGGYTHTSVAIRDALEIFPGKKVEVHLSKVNERDDFRKINYITDVCDKTFMGMYEMSYIEAIKYLKNTK
ncbi:MAG: 3-dehydroquinate dehydratase [Acholeplasmatales bacterium]|nr:3-dehydroquinate dehydratase [Acholeplasmatales bacterium]